MPGKYPTITSPLTTRTTLEPGGTAGLSNSDKALLKKMFPNSPIYEYAGKTAEGEMVAQFLTDCAALLQPTVQTGDADQFPGGVNLDYNESPDLNSVTSIGGVDIDSPYYPNLIANADPAGGEGTRTGTPLSPNDNFGQGTAYGDLAASPPLTPAATAVKIATTSIDVIGPIGILGQSPANSVNPGALGGGDSGGAA